MKEIKTGTRNCGHITASSSPAEGEAGRTGDWRVQHPQFDYSVCTPAKSGTPSCFRCWTFCPDGVITKTIPPSVNLEYCKGCGICSEVCPTGAITMVSEEN